MYYIRAIQFTNYGPFRDSGPLNFSPETSVLVAENGAGKTLALQAIQSLEFPPSRQHRSPEPVDDDNQPQFKFELGISTSQLRANLATYDAVRLPLGQGSNDGAVALTRILRHLSSKESLSFTYRCTPGRPPTLLRTDMLPYAPIFGGHSIAAKISSESDLLLRQESPGMRIWTFEQAVPDFLRNILRLDAERFNIGTARIEGTETLRPDAANLPAVLNHLVTNNLPLFRKYLENVRTILPHIQNIQAPVQPTTFDAVLKTWNHNPDTMRSDLATPLTESGTGVAQILALVYVLTTAGQKRRTILLDEPQAFLHPRALRNLLSLIRRSPQHQYIIATHAPAVLSLLRPESIIELRRNTDPFPSTEAVCYNSSDVAEIRKLLAELDVRWSELFGADVMVWVEGPTEANCFPLIFDQCIQANASQPILETKFIAVRSTGDFDRRKPTDISLILSLYSRVTHPQLVLPPRVVIILDNESRTPARRKELEAQASQAGVELIWLGTTMYEDFILTADALGALVTECLNEQCDQSKIAQAVQRWRDGETTSAEALSNAVQDLTDARWTYDKVRHGYWLTEWLIQKNPEHLAPLVKLLSRVAQAPLAQGCPTSG